MGYMQSAKYGSGGEDTVLVDDESGSMDTTMNSGNDTRLDGAKEANVTLIGAKGDRYPGDRVGVVSYSGSAETICPLTPVGDGKRKLLKGIDGLTSGGTTNITAGLEQAAELLGEDGSPAPGGPGFLDTLSRIVFGSEAEEEHMREAPNRSNRGRVRRIILLTDGAHKTGPSPVKTAERLKNSDIVIDCIGIGGSPKDVEEGELKKIASRGQDGRPRYWFIADKGKLVEKYEELSEHIRAT